MTDKYAKNNKEKIGVKVAPYLRINCRFGNSCLSFLKNENKLETCK